MLYAALVAASLVLLLANLAVHLRGDWLRTFFVIGALLAFGTGPLGFVFPPVMMLYLLLALSLIPWRKSSERAWRYSVASLIAFTASFGASAWMASAREASHDRFRAKYPLESLEARLGPAPALPGKLAPDAEAALEGMEGKGDHRAYLLELLHRDAVTRFVNSPGFGVSRSLMFEQPSEGLLSPKQAPSVRQPEPADDAAAVAGADTLPDHSLALLLSGSIEEFVSPGFGYVKDRQNVAGFQPHRFGKVPENAGWSIRRIELVSLLLHKDPVVYASDTLPRMDEARGSKTRPVDEWERRALAKLRDGSSLAFQEPTGRMLGAIRSAKQCVECHGGERGALLGAFSYRLRKR